MMAQTGVCGVSSAQASSEQTFSAPLINSSRRKPSQRISGVVAEFDGQIADKHRQHQQAGVEGIHAEPYLKQQRQQKGDRADGGAEQRAAVHCHPERWHLQGVETNHGRRRPAEVAYSICQTAEAKHGESQRRPDLRLAIAESFHRGDQTDHRDCGGDKAGEIEGAPFRFANIRDNAQRKDDGCEAQRTLIKKIQCQLA